MIVRLATALLAFFVLVLSLQNADEPVLTAVRYLTFNDINFLHTTDTHGWYSGHLNQKTYNANWGDFVSFAHHMRELAHSNGQDLILVDSGDRHDGNGLSDITTPNGARSLPVFMKQNYDIVTLGNHELYVAENSKLEFEEVVPRYGENYVCSNVEYLDNGEWKPFGNRLRYFETPVQKIRVLAFSFLFNFDRNNDQTKVTPIIEAVRQGWFQNALEEHKGKVDMIVVVGHMPVDRRWNEMLVLHTELRTHYPDIKIQYFGGHSHIRDFVVYDAKLTGLQSGRFCETIGFLSASMNAESTDSRNGYFRSYIDFNLELFMHHSQRTPENFATGAGINVTELIEETRQDLQLDTVLGRVTKSNYYMDYVPISHPKNLFRLLTEKVLPLLKPNPGVSVHEERLIIINTGSVRYDLYKGPYTIDSHYIISPFQNDWVKVLLPKHVAVQIASKLNENSYIAADSALNPSVDNRYLLPPHQRHMVGLGKRGQTVMTYPSIINEVKLTKGYVTQDDFGNDGDDTPHKAVVNYPIPNVVQSEELKPYGDSMVDVVFYNFIAPNVRWALGELRYPMPEVEFYSDDYLGLLLNDYVSSGTV